MGSLSKEIEDIQKLNENLELLYLGGNIKFSGENKSFQFFKINIGIICIKTLIVWACMSEWKKLHNPNIWNSKVSITKTLL